MSSETAIALALEALVVVIHRSHLRDPRIAWGIFELGALLILDRIARGEWAETIFHPQRRRKKRIRVGVAAGIVFAFFGWWIVRLPAEAKEVSAFRTEAEQAVHALSRMKPNPGYPCSVRKTRPRKPLRPTEADPGNAKILGAGRNKSHEPELANEVSLP
jgi:hypothetical protein